MPADRCLSCGTVGPAGSCACHAFSPAEQTAVLPPLDGPHLVRPYVAGTPVVEPGNPAADPFATRVGPPSVQPITAQSPTDRPPFVPPQASAPGAVPPPVPGLPPHVPQAAGPFAPSQAPVPDLPDAATQLLPSVPPQGTAAPGRFVQTEQGVPFPLGRVVPPQPQPEPPTALIPPIPAGPEPATALIPPVPAGPDPATMPIPPTRGAERPPADLGMFSFHDDESAAPVSRAELRSQRRRSADRKRLVIAGGAVGVTALAASLAMLLSSSPSTVDNALPAPSGPAVASSAEGTPSAPPSTEASPDASASANSPSPTRTSARPSPAATQPAAAPTTVPTSAPPRPTSATPSTQPSSSAPSVTLRLGDTGPDVVRLQQLLTAANCLPAGRLANDRTPSGPPGFGNRTRDAVILFQSRYIDRLGSITFGVDDPKTQVLLETVAQNPDC
ncbi:peptidoglycan-binding domain-containing protein [Kitasatospora griseola]|uniref:peptidoglycan-binding domain-containing protein n=1 Tax=Kitasatospora griseola TaxID=2064 RepID=UPI003802DF41